MKASAVASASSVVARRIDGGVDGAIFFADSSRLLLAHGLAAVAQRLGHVHAPDRVRMIEIGDGARDLERAMEAAR